MNSCWDPDPEVPAGRLFRRVSASEMTDGELDPARVFCNSRNAVTGELGMSTDWDRYTTPNASLELGRRLRPDLEFGLISFDVTALSNIQPVQATRHDPVCEVPEDPTNPNNRAHTLVLGGKSRAEIGRTESLRVRNHFMAISSWEVPLRGYIQGRSLGEARRER